MGVPQETGRSRQQGLHQFFCSRHVNVPQRTTRAGPDSGIGPMPPHYDPMPRPNTISHNETIVIHVDDGVSDQGLATARLDGAANIGVNQQACNRDCDIGPQGEYFWTKACITINIPKCMWG